MHESESVCSETENTSSIISKNVQSTKVSWLTYCLVCCFGIGSWITINGIWVELPNLINLTPEKYKLASNLSIICQIANIGPILYSLLHRKYKSQKFEMYTIYVLLILGISSCVFLSFFWNKSTVVFGKNYSVALYLLTFFMGLVDCTSSVTFLPYMVMLPTMYMSPLYVGETLSGFVPSLIALAQGAATLSVNTSFVNTSIKELSFNYNLRFSQGIYFLILAAMLLICFLSFIALNVLPHVKKQRLIVIKEGKEEAFTSLLNSSSSNVFVKYKISVLGLLIIQAWLNFLQNGVISSISSYSCEPYGTYTYHLAACFGFISSAIACFLFLWSPFKSKKIIVAGTVLHLLCCIYIFVVALQSPDPWLKTKLVGKILVVLFFICVNFLAGYTKLAIASIMRYYGRKYLFYTGVSNQLGSFFGAVVMFLVVNYTSVFKS